MKRKSWRYSKKLVELWKKDRMKDNELIERIAAIKNKDRRAFILALYYSSARVSEILKVEIRKENRLSRRLNNKWVDVYVLYLPNLKQRDDINKTKIVPINPYVEVNPDLIIETFDYLIDRYKKIGRYWDFKNRVTAWKIVKEETEGWFKYPIYPHIFRHLRQSHLAVKGVPADVRMKIAGHSDMRSQKVYTHLDISDMI